MFIRFLFVAAIVFLHVLFLPSCAKGPTPEDKALSTSFSPKKNKSLIYIYRPMRIIGSAQNSRVSLTGRSKGELPNGKFMCLEVDPGTHHLLAGGRSIRFSAKHGKLYFFRVDVSAQAQGSMTTSQMTMPIMAFSFRASQVDELVGRDGVRRCDQVSSVDAPIANGVKIIAE